MKPLSANYLNAAVLIIAGIYGYFVLAGTSDGGKSFTALIPAFAGVIFIILGQFWAKNPKVIAHIVAVLTLLMLGMCLWRFTKVEIWDAKKYIFLICVLSNLFALLFIVKSFIDNRLLKK